MHMRTLLLASTLVAVAAGSQAQAQQRRGTSYQAPPTYVSPYEARNRGYGHQYTQPPGSTGTIRWNTPNADGNYGAPTGGSSGSGG